MRWKAYFILAVILIFIIMLNHAPAEKTKSITGEAITGEATSSLAITVNVITLPTLVIDKPRNETYFSNESLKLKITTNADNYWYNLNNGANITLNSEETSFNAPSGSHTIYVFANSSAGTTKENVTFAVSNEIYNVSYTSYSGIGSTTNFQEYSLQELQNISNTTIESTSFGKIKFNEIINFTDDQDPGDDKTNIDLYIKFYSNKIELNSTALLNFNKSATLELYDLTLTTPRITKDGEVCPETICSQNSYTGGTLSFNVTHFTSYSVEETPVESSGDTQPSGGGGSSSGGGGGSSSGGASSPPARIAKDYTLTPKEIIILTFSQKKEEREIKIKNIGKNNLTLNSEIIGIKDIATLNPTKITLSPNEEKSVLLTITAPETGIYPGKIIFKSTSNTFQEVLVLINVKSTENPLFNVAIELPKEYKVISPSKNLKALVTLSQNAPPFETEVNIKYIIKNFEGEVIYTENETLSLYESKTFVKEFKISEILERKQIAGAGIFESIGEDFILGAELSYPGGFTSASVQFKISKEVINAWSVSLVIFIILTIIIIILGILKYKKSGKIKK